jgi:hypothetical protein
MNTTIDELHTFSQDRRHTARPPDDLKVGWRPD